MEATTRLGDESARQPSAVSTMRRDRSWRFTVVRVSIRLSHKVAKYSKIQTSIRWYSTSTHASDDTARSFALPGTI